MKKIGRVAGVLRARAPRHRPLVFRPPGRQRGQAIARVGGAALGPRRCAGRERAVHARLARARFDSTFFFFSFPSLFSIVSHPRTGPAAPAGTWRPPNPGCGLCWGRGRWWSTFFWRGGRGRRGRGAEKKRAAPGGERECRSGPHRGLPSHSFFTPRCLQRRPDTHTHTHHPPHAPLPVGHRPGGRPALQAHQAGPAPAGAVHGPEVSFAFFFFVRGFVGSTPGRRIGRPPPRPAGLAGLRARAHARIVRRGR